MAVDVAAELNALPVLEMLLKHGAAGDRPDAVEAAVRGTCDDCLAILKAAGPSLNAPDSYGYTPLTVAAKDGNIRMVTRLLDAAADPSLASVMGDRKERTAVTCPNSIPDDFGGLLEPVELTPEWKALFREKREDCIAVVRALIAHHANVNQANQKGETALMLAVDADSPETVELLLKAGARSDPRDKDGCTAVDRAKGNAGISSLLRDKSPLDSTPASPR
jgi:ankyrin repeat protein